MKDIKGLLLLGGLGLLAAWQLFKPKPAVVAPAIPPELLPAILLSPDQVAIPSEGVVVSAPILEAMTVAHATGQIAFVDVGPAYIVSVDPGGQISAQATPLLETLTGIDYEIARLQYCAAVLPAQGRWSEYYNLIARIQFLTTYRRQPTGDEAAQLKAWADAQLQAHYSEEAKAGWLAYIPASGGITAMLRYAESQIRVDQPWNLIPQRDAMLKYISYMEKYGPTAELPWARSILQKILDAIKIVETTPLTTRWA